MKKILSLVLIGILCFALVGCGNNGDGSGKSAAYDGPKTRTVGEITYKFSHVRDESEWAGSPSYLYVFISDNGEYLWYESKNDAIDHKNPKYCERPCTEDGYLHCHGE